MPSGAGRELFFFGLKQACARMFGGFLLLGFIWLAENIATFVNIWVYPSQAGAWSMAPLAKLSF